MTIKRHIHDLHETTTRPWKKTQLEIRGPIVPRRPPDFIFIIFESERKGSLFCNDKKMEQI
ncbi:uncharacterized mitochondrial protein atmg00660 [Phtheirospermum japonicum]|uniref:Uncharacterized mitochondrial protein atmg00660 n=1 Tax=Phtheirospermum japonicum TaxID=374723 RepID=A0A830BF43_9LAMI|nr:uncharacterized mitochondrial protein atmg00660 [Phtheirospermum japonicum]